MAAFNLAVVTRGIRADEFVTNAERSSGCLKQCKLFRIAVRETVGEFKAVIGLHTLDFYPLLCKRSDDLFQKLGRRVRALFKVSAQDAKA